MAGLAFLSSGRRTAGFRVADEGLNNFGLAKGVASGG
jgi:hypothetical protein